MPIKIEGILINDIAGVPIEQLSHIHERKGVALSFFKIGGFQKASLSENIPCVHQLFVHQDF